MRQSANLLKSWPAVAALYALLSLATLLAFSTSTSPLWPDVAFDQAIFSVIGRNWADGLLPYATAWDSKGPIVFFFNMLGHLISNGETGTFLLQAVNLTLVLLLSFFLLRRHCTARYAMACTLLWLLSYIIVNSGGNMVGDWTLLLSVATVMGIYRWTLGLEKRVYEHPWRWAVVYGMFLAACLLSRLTNAMLLVAAVCVMTAVLMQHGLWVCLLKNLGAFLLGFAVVAFPFVAYFAWHGLLDEMWYATVTYNVEYALHAAQSAGGGWTAYAKEAFFCLTVVTALLTAVLSLLSGRRRRVAAVWLFVSAVTLLWLLKGYAYAHYAISFLPILFVALLELAALGRQWPAARHALRLVVVLLVAGALSKGVLAVRAYPALPEELEAQERMLKLVPEGEPCMLYNALPSLYLRHDLRPCCPYFVCQDWAVENGPSLRQRVYACYAEHRARWILVCGQTDTCAIGDILRRDYVPIKKDEPSGLILYKLRE